ncbi:MAG: phosphonate ABC transporter, permease protein PhnE, partial [Nitrospina sp.]|nr:phosphonate ABC transporter, permease protein PhnE [Nitrospina sp.]
MKTKFFIITLAVLSLYSYGWKVTEIEVGELFRDFHLVTPLVKELAQPDLLTREKQTQIVEAEFFLSQKTNVPIANEGINPALVLSSQSGEISDALTVRGLNMRAEKSGTLYWVNAIEQEFPLGTFSTDSSGAFQKDITVP